VSFGIKSKCFDFKYIIFITLNSRENIILKSNIFSYMNSVASRVSLLRCSCLCFGRKSEVIMRTVISTYTFPLTRCVRGSNAVCKILFSKNYLYVLSSGLRDFMWSNLLFVLYPGIYNRYNK
jgi:hypothetical protein